MTNEREQYEHLRKKFAPTDGEKALKEMSDDKLLELTWDIVERNRQYYWGIDEQQYGGIHKMVRIQDVIHEANLRNLTFTIR